MKYCSLCSKDKSDDEFAWKNQELKIKAKICKECKRKYNKTWYEQNQKTHIEHVKQNKNKYKLKENKVYDKIRICLICDKEKSLTAFKLSNNGYRSKTCRSCINKRQRKQNPIRFRKEASRKRRNNIVSTIIGDCKSSDRRKNRIGNDLDQEFVKNLISNGCEYCGDKKIRIGLDRINNKEAHTKNNVIASCLRCNYIRGSMPYEAWLHIVPIIKETKELGLFGDWRSISLNRKY